MMRRYSGIGQLVKKTGKVLRDRWLIAIGACIIVGLLASLGGAVLSAGINTEFDTEALLEEAELAEIEMNKYLDEGDVAGALEYYVMDSPIGLYLVVMMIAFLLMVLYSFFVVIPLSVGYTRFNIDLLSRRKKASLGSLFFGFRYRYWKSIGTAFLAAWRLAIRAIVGCFAGVFLVSLGTAFGQNLLGAFFLLVGIIAFIWVYIRVIMMALDYSMGIYVVADRADLSPRQILEQSKNLMHGHRLRLLGFMLVLLVLLGIVYWGFFLLVLILGGIGLLAALVGFLFIPPFLSAACAVFYGELVNGGRSKIKLVNLIARK